MGSTSEFYRTIHKKNQAKQEVISSYLKEQWTKENLSINPYLLYKVSQFIYHNLLQRHNQNEFTPIEEIMTTVRNHINVVDCYLFVQLQEIQYNFHLATVWFHDGFTGDDIEKLILRRDILSTLEARTLVPLENSNLPSRQLMLRRLEEAHDFFFEPATQAILKDNVRIDLFTALKQFFELFNPVNCGKSMIKGGLYYLFNTTNDARVGIVEECFDHDHAYNKMMDLKRRYTLPR